MKKTIINNEWLFKKAEGKKYEDEVDVTAIEWKSAKEVTLPHTWFREEDQYRGLTYYKKELTLNYKEDEVYYIEFEGADQRCKVYCNETYLGEHKGAYATFRFMLPDEAVKQGQVKITVLLDNSNCEDVSPMFGDFTVFGGLFRNVSLLSAKKNHFDYLYFGTKGIVLRTRVEDNKGIIEVEPHTVTEKEGTICYQVFDESNDCIFEVEEKADQNAVLCVNDVKSWNGRENVNLYCVKASLKVDDTVCDEVSLTTGFKNFSMDPDHGAFLNGEHLKIKGVAKHEDFGSKHNAVTKKEIEKDFELISEIGANAVRLSHYQHPQETYDICDKEGYLVWAEIPMLKMTESEALYENTIQQLKELILQNIHHPSIFCWGIQNEIGMFKDAPYMHEQCKKLNALVKGLDPNRLSTAANLYTVKAKSELNNITDMIGYNIYFGWYYGVMTDYDKFLDEFHKNRPLLPLGVSEYGVDANLAFHSKEPRIRDYTEEYQALYHETVWPYFNQKEFIWGSFVWNMFDFSSAIRDEGGVKYKNAKGLVTIDREVKKDAFYYYKAVWSKEPFVHICGSRFVDRDSDTVEIKLYTNQPNATLTINGETNLHGTNNGNGTILFEGVKLFEGKNSIKAQAGECSDEISLHKVKEPNKSYVFGDGVSGGPVKNWFLTDDDLIREGYFSVMDTAYELVSNEDTKKVLEKYLPELVDVMVNKDVIPLGIEMKSILQRSLGDDGEDILKKINEELNQIKSI